MPQPNPWNIIGTRLADELGESREEAEGERSVGFGKQADGLDAVRERLDPRASTPGQRAAIMAEMRKQYTPQEYRAKMRQLLSRWSGRRGDTPKNWLE